MTVNWMKKGADSVAAAKQEATDLELRKEEQGKMYRFLLKDNEECQATFVDGDLSPEGFLLPPRWYEHMVFLNGKWQNFVCPEKTMPHAGDKCPICTGDRPSLVSAFTVIDHRIVHSTRDPSKVFRDEPKLFIAKPQTFEILNKIAIKRGGLAGCRFDISRTGGEKSAAVGTMFDFVDKTPIEELRKKYLRENVDPKTNAKTIVSAFMPADYESEVVFRSGDELRLIGFGAPAVSGYGGNPAGSPPPAQGTAQDYASQL